MKRPVPSMPKDWSSLIRRVEFGVALVISFLIVYLHIYRASHAGPLWRDEVCTLNVATLPTLSQLWSSLIYESFPLLPYLLVREWTGIGWIGSNDVSLRVLGATIGVMLIAVLWLNKRLFGLHAPIFSLVLFGLNPTVIQWGDSLRGYGFGSLLILVAYGLVWNVVTSPKPTTVAVAAAVSILSVQCLYQNAFLLLAICAGGVIVCVRKHQWITMFGVVAIGVVSALSLLPYLPTIAASQDMTVAAQSSFDFARILDVFTSALSPQGHFLLWAWYLLGGTCMLASIYLIVLKLLDNRYTDHADSAIFVLTILVISTVSFLLFLKSTKFATEPWYYLVLMATTAVSIDIVIDLISITVPTRIGCLIVTLAVAMVVLPIASKQIAVRQTDIDLVASALQEHAATGDLIVVSRWYDGITFQRYFQGNVPWMTAPPISDVHLTRYDLLKEQMMQKNPLEPVFDAMTRTLSAGHRVWVVGNLTAPPRGQLPSSLPPAPNGPNGWYSGDYLSAWTMQLGYFIQLHTTAGERIELDLRQPVSSYENAPLWEFSGWRS